MYADHYVRRGFSLDGEEVCLEAQRKGNGWRYRRLLSSGRMSRWMKAPYAWFLNDFGPPRTSLLAGLYVDKALEEG